MLCRRLTGHDVTLSRDDVRQVSWPLTTGALPVCCRPTTCPETAPIGDQTQRDVISPEVDILVGVEVAGSRRCFFTMNVFGMAIGDSANVAWKRQSRLCKVRAEIVQFLAVFMQAKSNVRQIKRSPATMYVFAAVKLSIRPERLMKPTIGMDWRASGSTWVYIYYSDDGTDSLMHGTALQLMIVCTVGIVH